MTPPVTDAMDRARAILAERIERDWPGWKVSHGDTGWNATRQRDGRVIRGADSSAALSALIGVAEGR
jgi:hypothetical protein